MVAENLTPPGIRSLEYPASIESLYRLHYPGPQIFASVWNRITVLRSRSLVSTLIELKQLHFLTLLQLIWRTHSFITDLQFRTMKSANGDISAFR